MTGETTVEVTLDDTAYDRLRAASDDPAGLLRKAGMRRVRVEEAIRATSGAVQEGGWPLDALEADGPATPVGAMVGFEVTSFGDGETTIVFEAGPEHANLMGTLHGGVLCSVADAAMGIAYATTLGDGESFATLELHVNFLRRVEEERVTVESTVVRRGSRVGLVECDARSGDGALVARFSSTCLTLRGEGGSSG